MNIIKFLFAFLLCSIATYFSQEWQKDMDETIALYQEVIRKDREDRLFEIQPLIAQINHLCKKESFLEEQYFPVTDYIKKITNKGIEEVYSVACNIRIEEFESLFGKHYRKLDSYDIIDYYYTALDQILDELDNPFHLPSKNNRAIIIQGLVKLPPDSVKIHAIPIEFTQGPAKEIRLQEQIITVESNFDKPLNITNPVTGKKQKLKFDKYFD